jgi:hypothetical protein
MIYVFSGLSLRYKADQEKEKDFGYLHEGLFNFWQIYTNSIKMMG